MAFKKPPEVETIDGRNQCRAWFCFKFAR